MDPHTESDRWLAISLKLLSTRDFLGSRTFAIRARESDPNNPSSIPDQILAIVDTILSSQNRVDPTQQPDWYSILQLPRLVRDPHLISDHYRRLSFLLNPDLNKFPFADFALQLTVNAWSVLSDPNQKSLFDHQLSLSSLSREPNINNNNNNNNIIGFGVPSTTSASINTFQFFQPPSNPDGGPLPPQWQMRDPTPSKGGKSTPPVDPTPPPPPPPPQPPTVGDATLINNANNFENNNNNAAHDADNVVESFWTSCPYCFYIYEYDKVYEDCTLRCGNCRRGFHAFKIPNPPLVGGEKGLFCCWSFYPLAFSMAAWKKHSEFRPNGVPNWVPFSPMFANPVGNGGGVGDFHMFVSNASACVGPRVVRSGKSQVRSPRVYIDDDDDEEEDFVQVSDPSDADTSDGDWRTRLSYKKKRRGKRGKRRGFKRGRPRKMEKQSQGIEKDRVFGGGVSVGGEDMEDECDSQAVVVGLVAGRKSFANKNMASAMMMRKHTRRNVKDMGNLDLNVEFNNEGDEHAPTVSAVNGEEDVIENIGFFEGLDEFLSTFPILNVGGDEKANKPS